LGVLKKVSPEFGCEIDVRNHGKRLVVIHDPFLEDGEDFEKWLECFNHKFLILNVKEEGLEDELLRILKNKCLSDYFILDESFPYIKKWAMLGVEGFAVRVSEYESYRTALSLASYLQKHNRKIGWVWADCFEGRSLPIKEIDALKNSGYKICHVSPELHHLGSPGVWDNLVNKFILDLICKGVIPDAVCTKLPHLWKASIHKFI
jgi:hypothetical protein